MLNCILRSCTRGEDYFLLQGLIKHDPIQDLAKQCGGQPGPLDEILLWDKRLELLISVNNQLDSPIAVDILKKLEDVDSAYATSFQGVKKEIVKVLCGVLHLSAVIFSTFRIQAILFLTLHNGFLQVELDTKENLQFLSTLQNWFEELHVCLNPSRLLKLFPPLIHTLFLVWQHSVLVYVHSQIFEHLTAIY